MKYFLTIVALTLVIVGFAYSQEAETEAVDDGKWHLAADAGLIMTQNAYSDNWSGGETGSILWTFNANLLAKKQLSAKLKNKTTLKLSYGQTHNQDPETKEWDAPLKSTDLIDLESVLSFTLGFWADPYAAGRFESQFLDGSDPSNERMFNPMKFTESVGALKSLWETEKSEWTVRVGFGLRQFIDRDVVIDTLTLDKETQTSHDGGLELVSDFTSPLAKDRINFTSKLTVFQALFYSEADDLEGLPNENYWKEVDINWENIFSANITKYIIVNLYLQLVYDKEVDLAGQFKQTLGLGLTYKFI